MTQGGLRPPATREDCQKGARKSAEVRRQRKAMRNVFAAVLRMPVAPGDVEEILNLRQARNKNVTVDQAIALVMVSKALKGDVQAAIFVRDTSGNKPRDEVEVTYSDSQTIAEIDAYLKAQEK